LRTYQFNFFIRQHFVVVFKITIALIFKTKKVKFDNV
jgi:hypothetical protein